MKVLVFLFVLAGLAAEAQVLSPQPSPTATVSTIVGLVDVKIEYSRPKAKGRKIFGPANEMVVPYGHIWRTGANSSTRVTFSDEVKMGGIPVPKGTYALFTIPQENEWTIIFSKNLTIGGNDPQGYDQKEDQVRVMVKPGKVTEKVETFTIEISDIADDSKSANIQLLWDNTSVKIPFTVDFDAKVMKSIEASTKVNPNNLYSAASYYLENGKDLKQAMEWINVAAAARPEAYWIWHTKAKILQAMGDKKGAMESAMASKTVAVKENDAAYVKMNDELMKALK